MAMATGAGRCLSISKNIIISHLNTRGCAAVSGREKKVAAAVMAKKEAEGAAWVPDPVTGYYRPENKGGEADAADMRNMLMSDYSDNGNERVNEK